jgi:hypothetical protein
MLIIKKTYYNFLIIYYNSILILLSFIDIILSFNFIKFLIIDYQGKSVDCVNKSLLVCISNNFYNKYNINIIELLSSIDNPEDLIKNIKNKENISYIKNKITDFINDNEENISYIKNKITDFINEDYDDNDDNISISTTKSFLELKKDDDEISIKSSNSFLEL